MGLPKRDDRKGLSEVAKRAIAQSFTVGEVLRVARRGADALTDAEREQLLADAVAQRDVRLELEAVTYIQRDTPNRNFVRFKRGLLSKLAASFAGGSERSGAPFLRDHDQGNALARGGTVLESKLIDHGGAPAFWMRIELTAPWAVDLALRGLLDRFSIGWNTTGHYECSLCGRDMFDYRLAQPCPHWPGQAYEVDGARVKCEAIVTDGEGVEVSAVSVPAVTGTEVQDVRAALALARGTAPAEERNEKEIAMLEQLRKLYGLPESATEEQILAAARAHDQAAQTSRTAAEKASKDAAEALATANKAQASLFATEVNGLIDQCRARVGQKIDPTTGLAVETELEASIREVAKTAGLAAAERVVTSLPKTIPTAAGTAGAPPASNTRGAGAGAGAAALVSKDPKFVAQSLSREQRKVLAVTLGGVRMEDVAKYGQEKPRKTPVSGDDFNEDEAAV